MKAYRKCVAFALVLSASGVASAQSAESAEAAPTTPPGTWQSFSNERHVIGRVLGGAGLRLDDAYGAGVLAPPFVLAEASFLFLNVGDLHLGVSVGGQLGFDLHSFTQGTIQPGVIGLYRTSPRWAFTGRVDVPILFTGGVQTMMPISVSNQMYFPPDSPNSDVGFGIEAAFGAAFYLTAGIAVTAEVSGDVYFGNSFLVFPVLGGGLGLMVDYEILP